MSSDPPTQNATDDKSSRLPSQVNATAILWWLLAVTSIVFSVYHIFYAHVRFIPQGQFTIGSIGLAIWTVYLIDAVENTDDDTVVSIYSIGLISVGIVSLLISFYFYDVYLDIQQRILLYHDYEYVLAGVLVLAVIEGTRRSYGNILAVIVSSSVLYALTQTDLDRILETNVLTIEGGVFGFIPQVGATWVVIFLLYAGLLEGYGKIDSFIHYAQLLGKRFKSGATQLAVLSSLIMGSISGSAAANTAATGSFTIPLMKNSGLRGDSAGGIESAASSGGQILPPIMGASAFVMASILNIPYIKVIQIALLPAIAFYIGVALSAHIISLKQGVDMSAADIGLDTGETSGAATGLSLLPFVVSIGVLIYEIAIVQVGPLTAGYRAILYLVGLEALVRLLTGDSVAGSVKETIKHTARGLHIGGTNTAPLMLALAGISIMVEMISAVGLTQTLTFAMISLSEGSLVILLVLAMLLSLLFGMGMPTVAAYVLVAILVGPTVVDFGLPQVVGHLFVLYFAVLSGLTPPFAIACIVACQISGANFFATCREALKAGLPGFILPFVFVYKPELLLWTSATPTSFFFVLIGLIGLIVAINNYLTTRLTWPTRIVAFGSSTVVLFSSTLLLQFVSSVILAVSLLLHERARTGATEVVSSND